MKREEHLKFCEICEKRKFDFHKGLLCSLTNELADFDDTCKSFEKDKQAEDALLVRKLENTGDHFTGDDFNYKKNKSQGFNYMALGIILTIMSIVLSDYLGFYVVTFGVVVYGYRQHARGVQQEKIFLEAKKKRKKERKKMKKKAKTKNLPN